MKPCEPVLSTNCRSKHTKCDEKRPTCGSCQNLGLRCEILNFFVPSKWSSIPTDMSTLEGHAPRPASTWDVFNHPIATLSSLSISENYLANNDGLPNIDSEMAELLAEFSRGVATWMDLFDHDQSYQRGVMRRAHSCPLIMQAICALTAKQLSLVKHGGIWGPVAVRYYGESLRLLISALADATSHPEDPFLATILLSSYELIASPGPDHRRHISGALSLIKAHNITARSSGLKRASFWIYARQDVAMALIHECPTMLLPEDWNICWAERETEEDVLGNQILWILAKTIFFTFQTGNSLSEVTLSAARTRLMNEINTWFNTLDSSVRGCTYGPLSREGFTSHWFAVPASGQDDVATPQIGLTFAEQLLQCSYTI